MPQMIVRGCKNRTSQLRACVETLESRRLLAGAAYSSLESAMLMSTGSTQPQGIVPAAVNPSVASTNPANGATNIPRYSPITLNLMLTNDGHGVDPATVTLTNVRINRTSDNQFVNANLTPDGAGAAITIQPTALLSANTQYTVRVTTGLKDTTGASFQAFQMTFTTGTQVPAVDSRIKFSQHDQTTSIGRRYSALAWGPDNKLYAGTLDGQILRFSVATNGTLGTPEVFDIINTRNGETRFIIGMEFDPKSSASLPILWVTHSQGVLENARDWAGKLTRLKGANLEQYTDYVINLPRSVRDHLTNQPHFGPDGAIYFSQASMNAMGAPDAAWVRADHPLSGAVLRVDVRTMDQKVDVKTPDGGGTYDPDAPGAKVTIYATGVRNGYDFVWHSSGRLLMPTNGSAAGGDTPAGPGGNPPAMVNVQETMHDYVYDIVAGGYYGQPNTTRNELILNGGNPTSGVDNNEVKSYPVGTQPDPNYRNDVLDLQQNYAPTGVIEYKSNRFGGALRGRLLMLRYSGGDDIFILTRNSNGTLSGINGVGMDGFNDPTDIIEDPRNGNVYVAQFGTPNSAGGKRITLLKPNETATFKAYVNFQPENAPVPTGYAVDSGKVYGVRASGKTYGWDKSAEHLVYDRNNPRSPSQLLDTGVDPRLRSWSIAVPDGTYDVYLSAGDPNDPVGNYNIAFEGKRSLVGATRAAKPWIFAKQRVTVTDGALTISALAGSSNHKYNFIEIVSV